MYGCQTVITIFHFVSCFFFFLGTISHFFSLKKYKNNKKNIPKTVFWERLCWGKKIDFTTGWGCVGECRNVSVTDTLYGEGRGTCRATMVLVGLSIWYTFSFWWIRWNWFNINEQMLVVLSFNSFVWSNEWQPTSIPWHFPLWSICCFLSLHLQSNIAQLWTSFMP